MPFEDMTPLLTHPWAGHLLCSSSLLRWYAVLAAWQTWPAHTMAHVGCGYNLNMSRRTMYFPSIVDNSLILIVSLSAEALRPGYVLKLNAFEIQCPQSICFPVADRPLDKSKFGGWFSSHWLMRKSQSWLPASEGDLCCEQQGMCSDLPYTSSDCETGMVGQSQTFLVFFCMWYAIWVWGFYVKTTPKFQSCGRSCGEIFQFSWTVRAESVQLGLRVASGHWSMNESNQLSFTLLSLKFVHQITSNQRSEPPRLRCELLTSCSCGDRSANRTSGM